MNVDPVTGEVALIAVGLDDALKTTCAGGVDYCRRTDTQLRLSLGGSGRVPHPGTLLGSNINGIATLRNGFVAVASQNGSNPLAAGVGGSIPSLTPLTPDRPLVSSAIALGRLSRQRLRGHGDRLDRRLPGLRRDQPVGRVERHRLYRSRQRRTRTQRPWSLGSLHVGPTERRCPGPAPRRARAQHARQPRPAHSPS